MRVVVALGNPGSAYAQTRHNAGFMLGDELVDRWDFPPFRRKWRAYVTEGDVGGEPVVVLKPRTYMNRSGLALLPFLRKSAFDPSHHLLAVVDDFALPLGTLRLRARGSAGGHNGLESIETTLGSREYARLRIGVGPLPETGIDPADFVLSPFEEHELHIVRDFLPTIAAAAECWVREGIDVAMNRFNRVRTAE